MYTYRRAVLLGLVPSLLGLAVTVARGQTEMAARKFEEKSGMVEIRMSMAKVTWQATFYFDDYGARSATVVRRDFFGTPIVQHVVSIGDTMIQWNERTMQGSRERGSGPQIMLLAAYTTMNSERKKLLKYKEIGTRRLLGKNAMGFSIDTGGVRMKVWLWHGIPLHVQTVSGSQTANLKATKLSVPSAVPAQMFQVPAEVIFDGSEQELVPRNEGGTSPE